MPKIWVVEERDDKTSKRKEGERVNSFAWADSFVLSLSTAPWDAFDDLQVCRRGTMLGARWSSRSTARVRQVREKKNPPLFFELNDGGARGSLSPSPFVLLFFRFQERYILNKRIKFASPPPLVTGSGQEYFNRHTSEGHYCFAANGELFLFLPSPRSYLPSSELIRRLLLMVLDWPYSTPRDVCHVLIVRIIPPSFL